MRFTKNITMITQIIFVIDTMFNSIRSVVCHNDNHRQGAVVVHAATEDLRYRDSIDNEVYDCS